MKQPERVAELLAELRALSETDFERHRIDVLERDLTAPPQVEIVDETHRKFNGVIYRKNKSGHFGYCQGLHRDVWAYHHGEIPEGYVVHHRDTNPDNNDISNLICLTQKEHHKLHATPDRIQEMCSARELKEFTCSICGKSFSALNLGVNKYCSKHCKQRADFLARLTEPHYCELCGKLFLTQPASDQRFCSRSCASKANVTQSIANLPKTQKTLQQKTCPVCKKAFSPRRATQKFCSRHCAMKERHNNHAEADLFETQSSII